MTQKPDVWMPLYVSDWDDKTRHLTCEQDGAYGRLVRFYWKNGPPPDDNTHLRQIVGLDVATWRKTRPVLARFFSIREGRWFHDRVEEELERAREIVKRKSVAGAKGAEARWSKNGPPNGGGNGSRMADASVRQWQTDAPARVEVASSNIHPSPIQEVSDVSQVDSLGEGVVPFRGRSA